jgi:copper chaperone NosL
MAISQLRYAAEMIDAEEQVFKFDDIGCMLRFSRARRPNGAVWFVMDYDSRKWLPAEAAHLVKSPSIQSPMGGGIIAFEDRAKAQDYARQLQGKVLGFWDLWQR